jgi:uncharacterized membrane protein HdeD (DUF308 family)
LNKLFYDERYPRKFGRYTLLIGILLVVIGLIGIVFPIMLSLAASVLLGWLLLFAAIGWAIHTASYSPRSVMNWFKPALLLLTGGIVLLYPISGIAMLSLLLAFYLILDAIASFTLARTMQPAKGWGWMAFNGFTSALLALLFLIGWPVSTLWLVGIFVGISLLFDGLTLVNIGWILHKRKFV